MRRSLTLTVGLALASACSGASGGTGSDGGAKQGGAVDMAASADLYIPGTSEMGLQIGPIPLAAGQERTVCSRFKLANASAIDVVQIAATLAPGSHHLIVYKSMETTEQKDIYDCQALDISKGDVPLYIAETEADNTLKMPTSVAYHIDAGQMVRIEAHYLNASAQPVMGQGNVTFSVATTTGVTYQPADIMFCGSVGPLLTGGVGPGKTDLPAQFWKPPAGIKLFGLTTHEHKRGTLMTVDNARSLNDTSAVNLTMGTPYDNPPFKVWDDQHLIPFDGTNGLRWQCHYQNDNPPTSCTSNSDCSAQHLGDCVKGSCAYRFGQSAEDNEMCFFWGYYYPSVGGFIQGENPNAPGFSANCWQ